MCVCSHGHLCLLSHPDQIVLFLDSSQTLYTSLWNIQFRKVIYVENSELTGTVIILRIK